MSADAPDKPRVGRIHGEACKQQTNTGTKLVAAPLPFVTLACNSSRQPPIYDPSLGVVRQFRFADLSSPVRKELQKCEAHKRAVPTHLKLVVAHSTSPQCWLDLILPAIGEYPTRTTSC